MLDEPARDALVDTLGRHYAAGRLDAGELDARLATLLGAATHEQAAAVLADMPPLRPADRPRRSWWRGRHGAATAAQPGWLPTPERFRDPSSGRITRVWTDPADGARHYVPD